MFNVSAECLDFCYPFGSIGVSNFLIPFKCAVPVRNSASLSLPSPVGERAGQRFAYGTTFLRKWDGLWQFF